MSNWFVIQTQPNQEFRAETHLRRQGYDVWLPCIKKIRRHARRVENVQRPLFPGYMFVRMDINEQPWRAINGTFGVRNILCQNNKPQTIAPGFIEALRNRAVDDGRTIPVDDGMREGNVVRIAQGPFEDYIGTILKIADRDRIMLMLQILGREVRAIVSRHEVVPANA
ncbi:transcription termination/antitermination protein NusG [Micavibrio aeruginosavorus]|uniref:NusG-like N-terminal domain-containing protein n=1 Tax=Micavibrio aeruginosavorus EPB TaxID=349215 RepID=M4VEY1_9BACT|nr:transcriptional activator RfaH [Micavibrio aeruginosavorus]AGH97788.1 hypothetical protein A11S_968 [Micavibrio aeruginosavorus EPB]